MSDNILVTQGSGKTILGDELTDGTLGTGTAQYIKLMDGTLDSGNKAVVNADGSLTVRPLGNAASGAADSGNPVKMGGVYNSSSPTLSTGNRGDLQLDVNGNLRVTQATQIAGEDLTNNYLKVAPANNVGLGTLIYKLIAAATNNAASVKASAATFYGGYIGNIAAYPIYVKLYNKASSPTVGTDTPLLTYTVQASQSINLTLPPQGANFSTGLAISITKGQANNDNTSTAANDCTVNLYYS